MRLTIICAYNVSIKDLNKCKYFFIFKLNLPATKVQVKLKLYKWLHHLKYFA